MSFDVDPDAYERFMGTYAAPLALAMLDSISVRPGQRAIDVGCGTGDLTKELSHRLGPDAVTGIDPSESFVTRARERLPGVEILVGSAEQLPFPDGGFDLAAAQLVVNFMTDPVTGVSEMARVTATGGTVVASLWDFEGERSPLSLFWRAAKAVDPHAPDESSLPGIGRGKLAALFERAGLDDVSETELTVSVPFRDFDAWWDPYTLGVGPAGDYVAALGEPERHQLRRKCAELLPQGEFEVTAVALLAVGRA